MATFNASRPQPGALTPGRFSERTVWVGRLTPLRRFVRTRALRVRTSTPYVLLGLALTRLSRGRLRPPVGWAAVLSAGTITGVGFTVSLLVANLAFTGARLDEAKLGLLGAAALAPA